MPETKRFNFHNKRNLISGDTFTVLVHNVISLSRHVDGMVSDNRIMNNDITGFIETQIKPSDSTCKIKETFNFSNINFNNNENKFLSLLYGYRNNVSALKKFNANGVSILSFKKYAFADRVLRCCNIYKQQIP